MGPPPLRGPSPAAPQGYQLEDEPYRHEPSPLPMPGGPHDRLVSQPTYSVENFEHSYSHDPNYFPHHEQMPDSNYNYHQDQGYGMSPQEEHHDPYQHQPYRDHEGDPYMPQAEHQLPYYEENDAQPILGGAGPNAYGPDLSEHTYEHPLPAPSVTPNNAPIKRWKTVKEVQLFQGNLVLDCPVPPKLLNQVPHAQPPERDEFTHMRYTAATCDPSEFFEQRFTLRQRLFAKPRHTELFIVVTMYNEDDFLFARTMMGVFKNIEYMCSRTSSKTWGKEAWKKIVVCVVSDGRAKINKRTQAVLAGLGVYQEGIAKQKVNNQDVTAHIYEYTTQIGMDLKGKIVQLKPKSSCPVQMLFCLKEKNQKKINSHRWFFQAFGRVLDPNICVLLDAGTKPGKDSIYHLWKAFDLEPMCGGACGEIKVMLSRGAKLINPLVAAQNFEYKMSNILDKPLESVFGFISVLPGAFSAYRYVALQNDKNGQGPLEKYFAGEKMHGANAGIFTANMYLAEDRILCFELVSKRNCRWVLQYVKSANGETDVPDELPEFISQRRRWLNGSFFAAIYAVAHFYQIGRSDHSFLRKFMLFLEFTYQTINMLFAWFGLGNFFLVFRILTFGLGDPNLLGQAGSVLGVVFQALYLAVLLACFVLALGNRPQGSRKFYMSMVVFWAGLMAYLTFASIFITVKSVQTQLNDGTPFTVSQLFSNPVFATLIVSLLSTWVMYLIASILFFDPWHMVTCFVQYLMLTPTYLNILNVYAFCNTHDITWGTKGDDKPEKLASVNLKPGGKVDVDIPDNDGDLNAQYDDQMKIIAQKAPKEVKTLSAEDKQQDYYKGFRSGVVLVWIFSNLVLAAAILSTDIDDLDVSNKNQTEEQRAIIYMQVILFSVAGLSAFRFIGAMWFLILRLLKSTGKTMAHPLLPLLILTILLLGAGVVGYVVYSIATEIADKTNKSMEDHHITFSKDGMKVGVKHVKEEDYVSATQGWLVKAWDYSTWPAYKSRLWNKEQKGQKGGKEGRKSK
ncbi:Chitin synthase, class 1 [Thelotrema lepadinum]|nr:Chitin synthase, class 1 [Thelotrema lepadinum]